MTFKHETYQFFRNLALKTTTALPKLDNAVDRFVRFMIVVAHNHNFLLIEDGKF